jgi:hypothetical protein
MPAEIITIAVRCQGDAYVAYRVGEEYLYHGASPDEALGYLMREYWLADVFERPVRLVLDIQSGVPFKYSE